MNNRLFNRLLIGALILVILIAGGMRIYNRQNQKTYNISVILRDSNDDRWRALKDGMDQAVEDDANVRLSVASTENFYTGEEEIELIKREIDNGADALIIEPIDNDVVRAYLEEISGQIPFVLVGSSIDPEDMYTTVHGNDIEIGAAIADALIDDYGKNLSSKNIGIVAGPESQFSTTERLKGFRNRMEEYGVDYYETFLLYSDEELADNLLYNLTYKFSSVVVCLNSYETELTADTLSSLGKLVPIYGQGYSDKNVYYLDSGRINTLVVANDFNAGYIAVENVIDNRSFDNISGDQHVEIYTVDNSNLYDEKIANIMFPVVQ